MPSHGHAKHQPPQQRHPLALTVTPEVGGSNSVERIEWSRTTILGFIEDYRRQRVLWDPNTKGYHIKQIKYEALKQLGHKYGTEIRSIRSKIKSLRSSFHREHGKVINGQRHGIRYQPMWFAYEAIRFILDGEQHQQQQQQQQQPRALSERGAAKRAALSAAVDEEDDEDEEGDDDDDDGDCEGEGDDAVGERVAVTAELATHAEHANCVAGETQVEAPVVVKQRHNASGSSNNNRHNNNSNNKHNVVVAAVVAAGVAGSSDDERDVKRSDSDTDMSHFGNIISAEDVKTELFESDTQDLHKSPLAYLALTPTRVSTSSSRKRKRTPQPDDLSLSAASHHHPQLQQQQHKHESATPAKFAHSSSSRAQEPSSTTTAAAATTSGSSHKQQHNNSNGNNFSAAGQTDEYGVFGEYVAITIRKLKTSKAKIVVKHLINNLLYEAELGKYDYGIPSSKEPPQLYKTT